MSFWARIGPFFFFLSLLLLISCGGGGGGGSQGFTSSPPPPPAQDFSLSLNLASPSVNPGNATSFTVSAAPSSGFSGTISAKVTADPPLVTVAPASFNIMPGSSQTVTVTAPQGAPATVAILSVIATAGSLTHTSQVSLTVNGRVSGAGNGAPSRTRYVRTDATTEYFTWVNPHWTVFNPTTSRFFITDPQTGLVLVADGISENYIGSISVPGAFGIDDTPDHKTLYVGTLIGDVYTIDPVTMTVSQRYPAAEIGPFGFSAFNALVMADGRLALLGAQGGIPSVDGSQAVALWNPADNSFTLYGGTSLVSGTPLPCGGFHNIGGFSRTVDRTKMIVSSIDSDGTLCEIDENGVGIHTEVQAFSMYRLTQSPDGHYLILPGYPSDVFVYDASTLNLIAQFPVNGDLSSASGFFVSGDSKTLFIPSGGGLTYAYDLGTHQQVGWLSMPVVETSSGGGAVGPIAIPNLQAVDGTGLFAGPMEEGIGFVDSTALQRGPFGSLFSNGYLTTVSGPVAGGTKTNWSDPNTLTGISSVYFGSHKATSATATAGTVSATTPAGAPGPADVYAFSTDSAMQILPEGFSYGPAILEVTPNMATVEGGEVAAVFGYGLGPVTSNAIPSDLKISVGGTSATVISYTSNAYGIDAPPFQLEAAAFAVPAGVLGSVDVTVTTSNGSTTAHGALTYLPGLKKFPLPAAALAQGIYDPHHALYYFTDRNQIQVLSLASGWQAPIVIPAPAGQTQRLWSLALSPDGSKLAISDAGGSVIYLLDPSNPASVQTFSVAAIQVYGTTIPWGVAVSDAGDVYFTGTAGNGGDTFFKLNTATGAILDYQLFGSSDSYARLAMKADNSRVFVNDGNFVFYVDTTTDKIFPQVFQGCCANEELTLSNDQTRLSATGNFYDANLNPEAFYAPNDRELIENIAYVYGAKLSADGSLLFQPSTDGIDVYDGHLGTLLNRIALPVTLSPNYDALVADGKDNILVALTGSPGFGVSVIDLTSLPGPPPLPYATGSSVRPMTGMPPGPSLKRAARPLAQNARAAPGPAGRREIKHVTQTGPAALIK